MTAPRTLLGTSLAVATALALSACSSDSPSTMGGMDHGGTASSAPSAAASADVGEQDIAFAQSMKPHHEQAVEMSDTILATEGISAEVTDLATRIRAAQQPEIAQLDEWLTAWGADDPMSGADHDMGGMMTDEDMAALDDATGAEAETLFLQQMIEHHEGAVEMAQAEVDGGRNPDAVEMATSIVSTQQEEITTMQGLLAAR